MAVVLVRALVAMVVEERRSGGGSKSRQQEGRRGIHLSACGNVPCLHAELSSPGRKSLHNIPLVLAYIWRLGT